MEDAIVYALPPGGRGVESRHVVPNAKTDSAGRCRLLVPTAGQLYDIAALHGFQHAIAESIALTSDDVELRLPALAEVRFKLSRQLRQSMRKPGSVLARLDPGANGNCVALPGRSQRPSGRQEKWIEFQLDGLGVLCIPPGETFKVSFPDLEPTPFGAGPERALPRLVPTPEFCSAPATINVALVEVVTCILDLETETGQQPQQDWRELVIDLDWGQGARGDSTALITLVPGEPGTHTLGRRVFGDLHAAETTLRWSGRGIAPGHTILRRDPDMLRWLHPKVVVRVPDLRELPVLAPPLGQSVDVSVFISTSSGGNPPSEITLVSAESPAHSHISQPIGERVTEAILKIPPGARHVDTQLVMRKGDWVFAHSRESHAAAPVRYDGSGRRVELRVVEAGLAEIVPGSRPPRELGIASIEILGTAVFTRDKNDVFQEVIPFIGRGAFEVFPGLRIGPLPVGTYRYSVVLGGFRVAEHELVIEKDRVANVSLSEWDAPPR